MTSASSSVSEEEEEEEEEDSSMEAMPNLGAEVSERSFRKWREESYILITFIYVNLDGFFE